MAQDTVYRYPVTFEVVVRMHDIDEAAAEARKKAMNNPALAADPMAAEMLERDRRLLAAPRARPSTLLAQSTAPPQIAHVRHQCATSDKA